MPLFIASPIKVTATKVIKLASFLALKTHFSFQKKLFIIANEKETAFKGIIESPLVMPVTKISKFRIPKSIAVFKTPTWANLENCQSKGIFLDITPAKAKPTAKITGSPAKSIAKSIDGESFE